MSNMYLLSSEDREMIFTNMENILGLDKDGVYTNRIPIDDRIITQLLFFNNMQSIYKLLRDMNNRLSKCERQIDHIYKIISQYHPGHTRID